MSIIFDVDFDKLQTQNPIHGQHAAWIVKFRYKLSEHFEKYLDTETRMRQQEDFRVQNKEAMPTIARSSGLGEFFHSFKSLCQN